MTDSFSNHKRESSIKFFKLRINYLSLEVSGIGETECLVDYSSIEAGPRSVAPRLSNGDACAQVATL